MDFFVVRSTRTQPEATDRHRQSPPRVHSNTPKKTFCRRGLGARERRARGDGQDERNETKTQTKSGAQTRPRAYRQRAARGLPAQVDQALRARRASARLLMVRPLPAGAGPRSERAAHGGRRTGRTKRRQTPNEERRVNAAADSPRARGALTPRAGRTHVSHALPAGAGPRSERAARAGRRTERTKRRQPPNEEQRLNATADPPRARGSPNLLAGRPHASRSAWVRAPAHGASPSRRRGASERGSSARGGTDGTNETTPNPQ